MWEVKISLHSPWQTPYAERAIGSIWSECFDHIIILEERHLRRLLSEYVGYYIESRPHQSMEGNSPVPGEIKPPSQGTVVSFPYLGRTPSPVLSRGVRIPSPFSMPHAAFVGGVRGHLGRRTKRNEQTCSKALITSPSLLRALR